MTRRKAADLRLLEGRRAKISPKPAPLAPNEPDWAPIMGNADSADDAAACWAATVPELERLGLATALDGAVLTEFCVTWARLRECERELGRDGLTVEGYRGSRVKHPAATIAGQYRAALLKLAHAIGLSPASRQQLDAVKPQQSMSVLEEIMEANRRS